KRLHGETVPLDAAPGATSQFGFTIRVPVGVVAAIAPFNFPLNLVCHKVGPALAAGNAVVLKPAGDTPLSGLKLVEILLEAGLPEEAIQCVTGSGGEIGDAITGDPRVRKITFTGSMEVGDRICRNAGIKKVTMELGSNSPLIIMSDADIEKVAAATVASGFANAGQVCISTQRVLADRRIYADFLDAIKVPTEAFATGDPLDEAIKMGPMIRESDATRVSRWINEAVDQGARVVAGGDQ
ncbi:MAG: aldehyde dehydrogenase family protein, partial [Chloroflexota bacterium]|nr:aldehyde dehydrogenase family protein [Chloroflexota bacterium]